MNFWYEVCDRKNFDSILMLWGGYEACFRIDLDNQLGCYHWEPVLAGPRRPICPMDSPF